MVCIFIPSTNIYSADKNTKANESDSFPGITVGSRLQFGNYPFEADGTEKPIEWIVLERYDDGSVLMITRYAIDNAKFHDSQKAVKWKSSHLRKWLNGEFYKKAFSKKERKAIKNAKIKNEGNKEYNVKGSGKTSDRVFVLSIEEAEKYFNSNDSRRIYATPYTARGISYSGTMWHWLRSPGSEADSAAEVGDLGEIDKIGYFVSRNGGTVRPAVIVKLKKISPKFY